MKFNFYQNAEGATVLVVTPSIVNSQSAAGVILDADLSTPILPQTRYGFSCFPCRRAGMWVDSTATMNAFAQGDQENIGIFAANRKQIQRGLAEVNGKTLNSTFDFEEMDFCRSWILANCPLIPATDVEYFFDTIVPKLRKLESDGKELLQYLGELAADGGVYAIAPLVRGQFAACLAMLVDNKGELSDKAQTSLSNLLKIYDGDYNAVTVKTIGFTTDDAKLVLDMLADAVVGANKTDKYYNYCIVAGCFLDCNILSLKVRKAVYGTYKDIAKAVKDGDR